MREDFSEYHVPPELIEAYPPNPTSLFELLCGRVTEDMLLEIARFDFGNDIEENLAGLRDIVENRRVPDWLDWNPAEVLALMRGHRPLAGDTRGHTIRAFCASCFLVRDTTSDIESALTVAASALHLDEEVRSAAKGNLAYLLGQGAPWEDGFPFHAFAVTVLASFDGSLPRSTLDVLTDWLLRVDNAATECRALPGGLTPPSFAHAIRIVATDGVRDLANALLSSTEDQRLLNLARKLV